MKEKIIWIIAQECEIPPNTLEESTRFDSLSIDSLEFLCLFSTIAEQLGKKPLSDAQLFKINTIGDAIKAFEEQSS